MSKSESSDEDIDPFKGPVVNTSQVHTLNSLNNGVHTPPTNATGLESFGWRRLLGQQYGSQRQLYDALGYERQLRVAHYIAKYNRGPGIARGIVEKPIMDCWSGELKVVEAEETSEDETEFERVSREFLQGRYTRIKPSARMRSADRWCRILKYSLILIGVQDSALEEGRPSSLSNAVDDSSVNSMEDIKYLSIFDERDVDWSEITLDKDPTSERYLLPETYNIDFGDDVGSQDVHHSRLLHIVEEPDKDELKSPSVYKSIFNRLEDLEKLLGGSAEMFWRAAWPGLVLTPPTDADGVPMKFEDDGQPIHEQIRKYRMNLDRVHQVNGNLEKLDTQVADPLNHVMVQYQDISSDIDIPMSILRGNETGERATAEDRQMYNDFIFTRRVEHCEEQIVRGLYDRFLEWGAMPETQSGENGISVYKTIWPPTEQLNRSQEADVALKWAQAYQTASGGEPLKVATAAEIRKKVLELDPEYGSEAPWINPQELAAGQLEVDEDAEDFDVPESVENKFSEKEIEAMLNGE